MNKLIGLIALSVCLTACASLPTPPRITQDPAMLQAGMMLMQKGQYRATPVQPTQTTCVVSAPNTITGQSLVTCH